MKVKGTVVDEVSTVPLAYATVYVEELGTGTSTDESGHFILDALCEGAYHFRIGHLGCAPIELFIDLAVDTTLNITMHHTSLTLDNLVVEGKQRVVEKQPKLLLQRKTIEENLNRNLADLLASQSGVHVLKTGSSISKPIVHGTYGNRLTILNNGIVQGGQQWGNDHSPEIDPYVADKITIVKGASAIAHGGGNLGNVILIEPTRIASEPHIHGQANYSFESNGLGHNLNTRLEKYSDLLSWRVSGTLKKYGDRKTSKYYLRNTGLQESDLSLQLEKTWQDQLFVDFYASTFNTTLGVLRGAHIGNLTDLKEALQRDEPFFTEKSFSYDIAAPKQEVSHHLAKLKTTYQISDVSSIQFVLAGQLNNRKEFDIRRGERTKKPALSLKQYTANMDIKYDQKFNDQVRFMAGIQNYFVDNTNNPETGILPLIPDYRSWKTGVYSSVTYRRDQLETEVGIRYDYNNQEVLAISSSLPRRIERHNLQANNLSGVFSTSYRLAREHGLHFSVGVATRNPAINELFSAGLHQGVSGIEEGEIDLESERGVKSLLEYKWVPSARFNVTALAYYQYIKDYIYLAPQDEFRLTIRGAFPYFKYEQTNASITGLDISSQFTLRKNVLGELNYSFIRGNDLKQNLPLIFMPPNRLLARVMYQIKSSKGRVENIELEINNKLVFRQNHLEESQDFLAPPDTYNLLGFRASSNMNIGAYRLRFFANMDNVFNVAYRDYLNRQRYFADDLGFSLVVGVGVKF